MPKPKKKMLPVYMTDEQKKTLREAAKRENIPLSTYLVLSGLRRAEVMHGLVPNSTQDA